jgi:hypothetical protein
MLQTVLTIINVLLIIGAVLSLGMMLGKLSFLKNAKKISMNPFDQYLEQGLEFFNNFVELLFLKYIHNVLIQKAQNEKLVVKALLDECINGEKLNKLATGFVLTSIVYISNDLKALFYRFYQDEDEKEEEITILQRYLSEWFILRIRKMQAEYTTAFKDDFSINRAVYVNSEIFISIETELYLKLGIVKLPNKTKIKKEL